MGGPADHQSTQVAQSPRGDRYVRLVEINVRHEFYSARDGVCTDLAIAPTPQTAARLAMFGLITRQRSDGIDLIWQSGKLIEASGMLAAVLREFGELPPTLRASLFASPLLFTVSLANPEFANFTDMPTGLAIGEPPLLLSNIATTITSGAPPDFAADLTLDWAHSVERPVEPQPAIASYLKAARSGEIKTLEASGATEDAVARVIAAVLSGIEAASEPPTPKNSAEAEWQQFAAKSTRFALLQLHLAPPSAPRAGKKGWNGFPFAGASSDPAHGLFTPCSYRLRFAARRTTWRYLVAARSGSLDPDSLAIVGADDGSKGDFVRLDAPETLPSGQLAVAFESATPIAIRQQPAKTYKLLGNPLKGRKAQTILIPALPIAGTGRIAPATGAPPGQPPPPARSDIYVFI